MGRAKLLFYAHPGQATNRPNEDRLWQFGQVQRIAGVVVGNLEAQELLEGGERFRVLCGDADARSRWSCSQPVVDAIAQPFHGFCSWRVLRMNEHRRLEVSLSKHGGNVPKMRTNLVPAGRVLSIVGFHFDTAAIRIEPEMMRGFFVREAHYFIAAFDQPLLGTVLGQGRRP